MIGYAFVLPRHHVPVSHELSIGFASTVVGAVVTYVVGVVAALRS